MLHLFALVSIGLILTGCGLLEKLSNKPPLTSLPSQQTVSSTAAQPAIASTLTNQDDPYLEARLSMVKETIESRGVVNPDVLRAMSSVPRHEFVPSDYLVRPIKITHYQSATGKRSPSLSLWPG